MKQNFLAGLLGSFVGVALLLLIMNATGLVSAQGPGPQKEGTDIDQITVEAQPLDPTGGGGPNAPLGTTFSYQGQLKINGMPYTGNCDMQFTLWNGIPGSGGISITTVSALPAPTSVNAGLFTTYVDFGDQFQGDYRQIEPRVRCPSGVGAYQSLGAQVIHGVPYALGLRPGTTITGSASTALTSISSAPQGTGLIGQADNGSNAWGVAGFSTSGIGVYAFGGDNTVTPNTALRINGGKLFVSGSVKPAFVLTVGTVSSNCASLSNPLFNGDSNAMIFVTPRQTATTPATDVWVKYASGSWYLCSPLLASGQSYNILVINQ